MGYGADYSQLGINAEMEREDGPSVRPSPIKLQWEKLTDTIDRLARTIAMVETKFEDILTPRGENVEGKLASGEVPERDGVVSPLALSLVATTGRLNELNERLARLLNRNEL